MEILKTFIGFYNILLLHYAGMCIAFSFNFDTTLQKEKGTYVEKGCKAVSLKIFTYLETLEFYIQISMLTLLLSLDNLLTVQLHCSSCVFMYLVKGPCVLLTLNILLTFRGERTCSNTIPRYKAMK